MFVLYVIFSMSLLAKIGATHRALELRLAVLRLIFLNVIDKYLSGLTCKLRNCRYTAKCKHANNNTTHPNLDITQITHVNCQEMPFWESVVS